MYIYEVPQVTAELVFFPSVVNHRVRFLLLLRGPAGRPGKEGLVLDDLPTPRLGYQKIPWKPSAVCWRVCEPGSSLGKEVKGYSKQEGNS